MKYQNTVLITFNTGGKQYSDDDIIAALKYLFKKNRLQVAEIIPVPSRVTFPEETEAV